jgi:glucokinase
MVQIGFDVGGTNIAAGIVDSEKRIIQRSTVPFPAGEKYDEVSRLMACQAREMLQKEGIDASLVSCIGIAVPGSVDSVGETVIDAYNLQFHNVPLKKSLREHFPDIPVYLANDANAAALAELHAGAFMGCRTCALFTLGTGVGGGLIIGGRMFNGGLGNGVELGHMILEHGEEICSCGNRGCTETLCTATALIREGRKAVVEHINSAVYTEAHGVMDNVTAKLVIDCARAGDRIALDIFDRYIDALSSAVASIINLLDPEVVAIGGGVSLAGDFLFEPLRALVHKKAFFKNHGTIVPAKLGNEAGIIGAAMLGMNEG